MFKLLLGAIKGGVIGGAIGYGAYALRLDGGMHWLVYGLIGFAIGLLVGKPFWTHLRERKGTIITPIVKSIFGYGITVGIFALVAKAWGGFDLDLMDETRKIYDWQPIFGAFLGALYGAFVEIDDASDGDEPKRLTK